MLWRPAREATTCGVAFLDQFLEPSRCLRTARREQDRGRVRRLPAELAEAAFTNSTDPAHPGR